MGTRIWSPERLALALVVVCALGGIAASSASAATTIGSGLLQVPNGGKGCDPSCTAANASIPPAAAAPGGAFASAPGVVTSWAVRTGSTGVATPARLRVMTGNAATGASAQVTLAAIDAVQEFDTRIPIAIGQRLGLDYAPGPDVFDDYVVVVANTVPGATHDTFGPALPESGLGTPTSNTGHLLLQARIEPDGDGDGFGDETQDGCLGNPAASGTCPVVETTITRAPKKKIRKRKATFEFAANLADATFECALDDLGFSPCASPEKVKHLKRGKHTFEVRALAAGAIDTTPAKARFRVKRKRK